VISNLFIKFYLDTSISRYIFIVKIFLEIFFQTFSPRPAALPVVQAVPVILRTDPPAGDINPRQPGRVSLENPAKIKKDSRYNLTR
jgi:hypothetical protein